MLASDYNTICPYFDGSCSAGEDYLRVNLFCLFRPFQTLVYIHAGVYKCDILQVTNSSSSIKIPSQQHLLFTSHVNNMRTCMYMYVLYVHVFLHLHMHITRNTHTHTHTYMHMHTHVHAHAHTPYLLLVEQF